MVFILHFVFFRVISFQPRFRFRGKHYGKSGKLVNLTKWSPKPGKGKKDQQGGTVRNRREPATDSTSATRRDSGPRRAFGAGFPRPPGYKKTPDESGAAGRRSSGQQLDAAILDQFKKSDTRTRRIPNPAGDLAGFQFVTNDYGQDRANGLGAFRISN